jgi:hypothetical protein
MSGIQENIGSMSSLFLSGLDDTNFKLTAINTDMKDEATNYVIERSSDNIAANLEMLIKSFGTNGSPDEVPFQKAIDFILSNDGESFFAKGASKEIIIVTDEEDQSLMHIEQIKIVLIKNKITVNAIANNQNLNSDCSYTTGEDTIIQDIVWATGGTFIDLCKVDKSILGNKYLELAKLIADRATPPDFKEFPIKSFPLPTITNLDSIKVFYGSQIVPRGFSSTGWIINEQTNSLLFGDSIKLMNQPIDTKLTIQYDIR